MRLAAEYLPSLVDLTTFHFAQKGQATSIGLVSWIIRVVEVAEPAVSRFVREYPAETRQWAFTASLWLAGTNVCNEQEFQQVSSLFGYGVMGSKQATERSLSARS